MVQSCENAKHCTSVVCPLNVVILLPVATSHKQMDVFFSPPYELRAYEHVSFQIVVGNCSNYGMAGHGDPALQ